MLISYIKFRSSFWLLLCFFQCFVGDLFLFYMASMAIIWLLFHMGQFKYYYPKCHGQNMLLKHLGTMNEIYVYLCIYIYMEITGDRKKTTLAQRKNWLLNKAIDIPYLGYRVYLTPCVPCKI